MKLMPNNLQTIGIIELEHIIYQWNDDVNAKYALRINDDLYFTEELLSDFCLSKAFIKKTLIENKVHFHLHKSSRSFIITFENKNYALAAVELFKPYILLAILKDDFKENYY